jgi:DnaK suppressor protein
MMLTDKERQTYESLLRKIEARIRADLEHLTDEALDRHSDSRSPQHMAELGTDAYEQEFSLRFAESDQRLLEEIHQAYERLKDGTFGLCQHCLSLGKPPARAGIAKSRLKEIPYARNCVECERDIEAESPR